MKPDNKIYEVMSAAGEVEIDDFGDTVGINDKSEGRSVSGLELPEPGPIGSIRDSAYANVNVPTRAIKYTQNGNLGCAAAVSIIFYRATGYTIVPGKKLELSTSGMWNALNSSDDWKRIDNWKSDYKPGDIILTARGKRPGHVGVVVDGGKVISNSSGGFNGDRKGQIEQNYSISGWRSVEARNPSKTAIFRYIGPFREKWGGPETSRGESQERRLGRGGTTVVFGGLSYATAGWMKQQWTEALGEPGSNVIFEEYTKDLSQIKAENPGANITKLIGFSAGARKVWPHVNDSSITFIGLIDPSTRQTDWSDIGSIPDKVKIMSNSSNWVSYKNTYAALQELEQSGKSEYVKMGHSKIPQNFLNQYKDQLLDDNSQTISRSDDSQDISDVLNIKYGSKGKAVVDLQRALISSGYDLPKYGVDGKFYKETRGALKRFQKDNGLAETGELDKDTKDLLMSSGEVVNTSTATGGSNFSIPKNNKFKIFDNENKRVVIASFKDVNNIVIKSRTGSELGTAIRTGANVTLNYDGKEINASESSESQVARSIYRIFNRTSGAIISGPSSPSQGGSTSSSSTGIPDLGSSSNQAEIAKKGAIIASKLTGDLGITKEQAAGVVGNLWAESRLIPDRIQGSGIKRGTITQSGSGGYAWAQYTSQNLKDSFISHAKSKGLDITKYPATDDVNYSYLVNWISSRSSKLNTLKSKKTVRDSAEFFVREFEKPASIIRGSQPQQQETINKRASYGNLVLSAMGVDISQPEKKLKVLFVGDSQTAGSNSYANKLLKSGRVDGKILAKTGANTYVLATALKKELDSGEKYDVISIMAGGNDAWRDTPAVPMQNLAYMYRISKESGARVVAISNPSKKNVENPSKYPSNDLIAKFVETGEHKADNRIYVNGNLSYKSNFEPDMIHLNNGAHNTIALKWERDILA